MLRDADNGQKSGFAGRLLSGLKTGKRFELLLYGALIAAVLILYAAGMRRDKAKIPAQGAQDTAQETVSSVSTVESKLASVLSCIRGAGRVEVMVTYESGTELVTAMSTNTNSNSSESDDGNKTSSSSQITESTEPATVSGENGDTPIVLMEKQPAVRGVIVVAEGAADISVRLDLQRAVQAVLDIPLSKIEVFEYSLTGME